MKHQMRHKSILCFSFHLDKSNMLKAKYIRFRARSHTGVMNYDEACFMHLTPGVVHNFPKAVGV